MADPNNILLNDHRLGVYAIPKVANTAMKIALLSALGRPTDRPHAGFRGYAADEIPMDFYSFGFIRSPVDRLVSAWREKCWSEEESPARRRFARWGLRRCNFQKFVDWVERCGPDRERTDQHVRSQWMAVFRPGNIIGPTELYAYERIGTAWPVIQARVAERCNGLALPDLVTANASDSRDVAVPISLYQRVEQLYIHDLKLWKRANDQNPLLRG